MLLWFAKRYIAGEHLADALSEIRSLNMQGIEGILDALGEDITNKQGVAKAVRNYIHILEGIDKQKVRTVISIKLSQLGLGIDYDYCKKNVEKILRHAHHTFVWIDMEGSHYTEDTVHLYLELHKTHKRLGVCIQSYLLRSNGDIERIIQHKGKVRMVKGAYKELPTIAFEKLTDVNNNFFLLTKILLDNRCFVQIASHDKKLLGDIIDYIDYKKIHKRHFEFAFLKGIRRKYRHTLVRQGYPVKVYVPFGKEWFPYFYRRVMERKENLFFVLKNLFIE